MPTFRANTAVDPSQISSAFDNIAAIFKPPTGQEIYAGAKAQEAKQKVQYLADAYRLAVDPNADQGLRDRVASIAGAYAPSSSFTAVGMNNRNALAINAADNARALQQTTMQQQGEMARALVKPLGADETQFLPPSIASAYGVPEDRRGIVKLSEGQTATLPNGDTLQGREKAPTEDNVKARVLAGMDPALQQAAALGSTPVEKVMGPNGPRIVTRLDSIGQTPAPAESKPQFFNYDKPDGAGSGTARTGPDGALYDTQTGEKLPPGVKTYTANLTGNKADTGLGQTTKNGIEGKLVDIAAVENTAKAYKDLLARDPGSIGIVGAVRGVAQDAAATAREAGNLFGPRVQQFEQDIINGRVDPEVASQFKSLIGSGYNPNIPNAKLTELLLASQVAKMMDPNGRISNDRMKQVMEGLGGGGLLANVDKTQANLDAILEMAKSQRRLYGASAPEAAKIGQTPGDPTAPTPGAPVRRRYNPATGALE